MKYIRASSSVRSCILTHLLHPLSHCSIMATRPTPDNSTVSVSHQDPVGAQAPQLGHTPVSEKRSSVSSMQQPILATADELRKRRRKLLDSEMLWAELPLWAWFQHCLPSVNVPDPLPLSSFVVDMTTERKMYSGLVSLPVEVAALESLY